MGSRFISNYVCPRNTGLPGGFLSAPIFPQEMREEENFVN